MISVIHPGEVRITTDTIVSRTDKSEVICLSGIGLEFDNLSFSPKNDILHRRKIELKVLFMVTII